MTTQKQAGERALYAQGTKVICNGHEGAIVRHYDGDMYEIRLPGGVTCTDEFVVVSPKPKQRKETKTMTTQTNTTPGRPGDSTTGEVATATKLPQHTPGPWTASKRAVKQSNFDKVGTCRVHGPNVAPVAKVDGYTREQVEANARLIAAAPELLAIAEEIAGDSRCDLVDSERRIRLYSAITKAGGNIDGNRPCTCQPDDNPPVPCAEQYALSECNTKAEGRAQ